MWWSSYLSADYSQILELSPSSFHLIEYFCIKKATGLKSSITKWEFMSLPLGSSPLQWVTHFFGPRVLCKVSIKNGDSSHFDQKYRRKEKSCFLLIFPQLYFKICFSFQRMIFWRQNYDFAISFHQAINEDKWWEILKGTRRGKEEGIWICMIGLRSWKKWP